MMKNLSACLVVFAVVGATAQPVRVMAQATGEQGAVPAPPAADLAMPYYDRHKIDISHLREFYEGVLIGDAMILADAMFDAETKWKMTLYQMVRAESAHYAARSAFQLASMGMPIEDIRAIGVPGYIDTIEDDRLRAAFQYIEAVANLPTQVTADTHAMLRMHYTDRQIAELMEFASFNAANALYDNVLPIATDQATLDWATENLAGTGWSPGPNLSSSRTEQRAALFAGEILEQAHAEIMAAWRPEDLNEPEPGFSTDWVNQVTGYDVSRVVFDADLDGVEDPYDFYPNDVERWAEPGIADANLPDQAIPPFDVTAYDFAYYRAPVIPETEYVFSDRLKFDTTWTRQNAMGTSLIEDYFAAGDRALSLKFMWQVFIVYQLSSGCVHCQVHGTYSAYIQIQQDYPDSQIPRADRDDAMRQIYDLFDFERSDLFTERQKAAFRLARDAGPLPTRTTAAHIEELRRHYADREIQEILMILVAGSRLSAGQQSNATVTDRLSMAWALRNLTPVGWKPGVHTGLPQEQRRYFMSEAGAAAGAAFFAGQDFDFSSEWVGLHVPLAVDADGDGVEDAYDGYPNDPSRWEDTDRDGIEDASDDDIDGDGLSNTLEAQAGTFPYKADSDGDGIDDPTELAADTDPLDPNSL